MTHKKFVVLAQSIPVTQFLEYQDYLKAIYEAAKREFESYSYLRFAEDLGFSATNVLRLVVSRKRRLSDKSARTVADRIGLRHEEKKYFLNLVHYGNVPSQETKAAIFLQIYREKKATVSDPSDKDLMEFYAAWYHPLILELINLQNLSQEPEKLAKCLYPRVAVDQIGKSVELLKRLQMIQWNEQKQRWVGVDQSPKVIPEDRAAGMYSLVQFHLQMMEMAAQSLHVVPRQEREFNALTIKLPTDQIPLLKEKIREFCASVMSMEQETGTSDRIIQVNIQMFPFTKAKEDQENAA